MKYIVYLTKNNNSKINGINRIYIGVHETKDPTIFDGYIGCGVYVQLPSTYKYPKTPFQYAVKKYGVDAFTRQILFIFDDKESAYKKEEELVDLNFLKLNYTYNSCLGGKHYCNYKKLFQFDLKGNLIKEWRYSKEAYEFYGIPMEKFEYAIHDKHPLLDSLWTTTKDINLSEYSTKSWGEPKVTHLYNKEGKWLGEFISRKSCAEYIGSSESAISKAISNQSLVKELYYVSDSLVDVFIPKPRVQYYKAQFFVYNGKTQELIFKGVGKKIMPIIGLNSWANISDIFRYKNGWYKNFYLSLEEISELPERFNNKTIKVDVYTKYGDYIETIESIKLVREKYNIPSAKIKNIELGDRYFGDYIFKYHNRKLSK